MGSLYINIRFFIGIAIVVIVFILGLTIPFFYSLGKIVFLAFILLLAIDIFLLYGSGKTIKAKRICPERLSNGDDNTIQFQLYNTYSNKVSLTIIDEIPFQFQKRDLKWNLSLKPLEEKTMSYKVRPTKRGVYSFGALNIFIRSIIGFAERRIRIDEGKEVPVYPSFLQMKKYELAAISNKLIDLGIKKIRRIGHSMEFEQIKNYVQGDDPRFINWKATARKNSLMINQFQDEKSQQLYCLIDKGRLMKMPFEQLSLLDYSINSSLVISNIALKKGDKSGLITFSNKISTILPASKKIGQISKIQEVLYNQKSHYLESNFELVTAMVARKINQRSLLLLFTNFETMAGLKRQLKYFRVLAKKHTVVVIFFKNTTLNELIEGNPSSLDDIYYQTIAEKMELEKSLVVKELKLNGIYSILTTPANLTIDTINQYLTFKAQGII